MPNNVHRATAEQRKMWRFNTVEWPEHTCEDQVPGYHVGVHIKHEIVSPLLVVHTTPRHRPVEGLGLHEGVKIIAGKLSFL